MKKLLLLAVATTVLAASADAESNAIYLRADAAANMFTKEKVKHRKFKSKASGSFDVGVGYKLMDTVRAELVYSHHFNPEAKAVMGNSTRSRTIRNKAKIDTLMVRGYVDIFDAGPAKLFVGAGLGLAQVKEEVRTTHNKSARTSSHTFKKKNNMTYSLMAGAGFGLADGISLDLQYIWSDFGKAKGSAFKRRSNALSAGVRLEL